MKRNTRECNNNLESSRKDHFNFLVHDGRDRKRSRHAGGSTFFGSLNLSYLSQYAHDHAAPTTSSAPSRAAAGGPAHMRRRFYTQHDEYDRRLHRDRNQFAHSTRYPSAEWPRDWHLAPRACPSRITPHHLTTLLKEAVHPERVLEIHERYGVDFNIVHLSACWSRLKREYTWIHHNQKMIEPLHHTTLRILQDINGTKEARGLANVAHGLAKCCVGTRKPWGAVWTMLASKALICIRTFKAQHISNVVWSFATVGYTAPVLFDALASEAAARAHEFNPQAIANTAWAYAAAGHFASVMFEAMAREVTARINTFDAQNIANISWAFATVGHAAPSMFDALAEEAASTKKHKFNSQEIANTVWAYATVGHIASKLFDAFSGVVAHLSQEFTPQGVAITTWAFAKAEHSTPFLFSTLADIAMSNLHGLSPQNIANIAWGFSKARLAEPRLFNALAERAMRSVRAFKPQELSNTLWAFAKAAIPAPALFNTFARVVPSCVRNFDVQNISNVAWAFATARCGSSTLFNILAREAVVQACAFSPQNIANTLWAFATAGHACPALFDVLAMKAIDRVGSFTAQNIANTAWAFVTTGIAAPKLFDILSKEAASRADGFNDQEVANTCWAFAKAGHAAPALFSAFASKVEASAFCFNSQSLANTAWAFATAGKMTPTVLDTVAKVAIENAETLKPQEIANLAWAVATTGHAQPALFDRLAQVVTPRDAKDFKAQEIANTLWAFASVGHVATTMFEVLAVEVVNRAKGLTLQNIANVAWAFAVAAYTGPHHNLLESALAQRAALLLWAKPEDGVAYASDGDGDGIRQLHQWNLWRFERALPGLLPLKLRNRCWEAFREQHAKPLSIKTSRLQGDVSLILRGLIHDDTMLEEEVVSPEGYSIDIVVRWNGRCVAIEVDGPTHFIKHSRNPTGATILKRRQLRSLGWTLASIPFWEWNAVRPNTVPNRHGTTPRTAHKSTGDDDKSSQNKELAREYLCQLLDRACNVSLCCIRMVNDS